VLLSLKCSTNISIQKKNNIFVTLKTTKDIPVSIGWFDKIIPSTPNIFIEIKDNASFLFPKLFNIDELWDRKTSEMIDPIENISPTYFSDTICVRKLEFIYAAMATCRANRKDRIYVLCIFWIVILYR